MNTTLNTIINKIRNSWNSIEINDLHEIQALMGRLALEGIDNRDYSDKGYELYGDKELGFVITIYSEAKHSYRMPHNHGNGWVIYSVVEGSMEMSNYINWIKTDNQAQLILKNKNILENGHTEIYYPGEIHDTNCLSDNAIILRLTSCDLRIEEKEQRMKRFNLLEK